MSEDPKPYRSDSIYVSWQTRKALNYVPRGADQGVDALADEIIADWLKTKHPKVVEHLKAQHEADQAFKKGYSRI